ncbi:MAG: DUF2249 domain-containing protein [Sulfuricurvum sp.]|nr:DUF2249 domain-containing protein [Sulfuricurvum sp.]
MILLDTRGLDHPIPLETAFQAFTKLHGSEVLHMIHNREPLPLFDIIANNGGRHYAYVDDDGAWHILITRDGDVDLESHRV